MHNDVYSFAINRLDVALELYFNGDWNGEEFLINTGINNIIEYFDKDDTINILKILLNIRLGTLNFNNKNNCYDIIWDFEQFGSKNRTELKCYDSFEVLYNGVWTDTTIRFDEEYSRGWYLDDIEYVVLDGIRVCHFYRCVEDITNDELDEYIDDEILDKHTNKQYKEIMKKLSNKHKSKNGGINMENNSQNPNNKDALKMEVTEVMREIVMDSFKNIGGKFFDFLCGGTQEQSASPILHDEHIPQKLHEELTGTPEIITSKDENLLKENFLNVVSGYLFIALQKYGYSEKDIRGILQQLDESIKNHNYYEAMQANESFQTKHFPVVIMGIIVPLEYNDTKISDLNYSSNITGSRITNALSSIGIVYIRDFYDKPNYANNLPQINRFGIGSVKEFKAALMRTIGQEKEISDLPLIIGGVVVPKKFHNRKVSNLNYASKASQTKIVKRLKEHNIKYLRDFYNEENKITKLGFSPNGRKSFLETLRKTIEVE